IGPFIGQNLSALKSERIFKALRLCLNFCLLSGLFIAAFLMFFINSLPLLFSQNLAVIDAASLFLLIAPISYGAYGVVMAMNAAFNGMGKPGPAVVVSVARMIVMYVPTAYILQHYYAISGIFMAYAIANICSAVMAYRWATNSVHEQIAKID
ncbi:MAG: MATE family efflux transporter, partial [Pseudomonadota bacterium]|nr:MATE family efflux transporter [Pseudomonadota bacterium]